MSELGARMRSFAHAFRGLRHLVQHEPNARIHLAASVGVCGLALFLGVGPIEWALLSLAIAGVFAAEALNTALEVLADRVCEAPDPAIGRAKDLAAGGVLVASLGAAGVGLWVLGPPLWALIAR